MILSKSSTPKGQTPKRVSFAVTPRLRPVFTPIRGAFTLFSFAKSVSRGFPPALLGVNIVDFNLSSSNATSYIIAEHIFSSCHFIMSKIVNIYNPESLLVFPNNSTMNVKRSFNGLGAKTIISLALLFFCTYLIQQGPVRAHGMVIALSRSVKTGLLGTLKLFFNYSSCFF